MTKQLLLKGFEVELFTGLSNGKNVGVAGEVTKDLQDFVKEPDQRNIEYITNPERLYAPLREALLVPRRRLRSWLNNRGLTVFPGSTLTLGDTQRFERSDFSNSYHEFIEQTYGTNVVTASVHINLGIENLDLLFAALRLVRCEAALFLALSASSPFLDGKISGAHSQRWIQFPRTPEEVPIFVNHTHYVKWIEEQLEKGVMCNERHLWSSVRPNGPNRPYELNRLELRICDLITDIDVLLSVTSLLELRVLTLLQNPTRLDPLHNSKLDQYELLSLGDKNDLAAANSSLDATLFHWKDGRPILCRYWIQELLDEVRPLAIEMNMLSSLLPIQLILENGNQAIKWLRAAEVDSVSSVFQKAIREMASEEFTMISSDAILG